MSDMLSMAYPWIKALHIMSVIAWMAGLFYLPRLFVYHTEQSQPGDSRDVVFQVMEYKLLRYIMRPSMIATWGFGLLLVMTPGIVDWGSVWPYSKLGGVLVMTWFHVWLSHEVPTLAMVVIVLSVVVKF
jgi:putative membrane protein